MLAHALNAARRGWSVFPAQPADKRPHPLLGDWRGRPTSDIPTIVAWWQAWPAANVAVACKPSGLLVIDCDTPKRPGDPDGLDEYLSACRRWGASTTTLFDTHIVATGSGGLHFYFQWPAGLHAQGARLHGCVNVDIRCNGGEHGNYVLGAGSVTHKGPYLVEHERDPAPCPGWLGQLVADPPRPQPPAAPAPRPQQWPGHPLSVVAGGGDRTAGVLDWLAQQQPGNQDMALQWVARCLRDEGVARDDAAARLWAVVAAWPTSGGPWSERDIERHLRQAYK